MGLETFPITGKRSWRADRGLIRIIRPTINGTTKTNNNWMELKCPIARAIPCSIPQKPPADGTEQNCCVSRSIPPRKERLINTETMTNSTRKFLIALDIIALPRSL